MLVSTDELAASLRDGTTKVIHIARDRTAYQAGHIPGARFVAWGEITATRNGIPNELPPVETLQRLFERIGIGDSGRLVLYGDQFGLSAARLYFTLDYLGHGARAALLDGGLEKWKAEERRTTALATDPKPEKFTPLPRPRSVTSLDVVRDLSWTAEHLEKPNVALIDARPAEEYSGAKPGEGVPRGGHIPGAANIFWMHHLVSRENPVMRPTDELRRLYKEAGAAPGQTVVTYCRTGGQAAHAYFTAKLLGHPVVMYDGSFIEWSNTADTPVERGVRDKR